MTTGVDLRWTIAIESQGNACKIIIRLGSQFLDDKAGDPRVAKKGQSYSDIPAAHDMPRIGQHRLSDEIRIERWRT